MAPAARSQHKPPRPSPPQLLGRAENLKDFIRRGCSEAWTEITLSGGGASRDMVVRREIRQVAREDGQAGYSSKWRLNGGRRLRAGRLCRACRLRGAPVLCGACASPAGEFDRACGAVAN